VADREFEDVDLTPAVEQSSDVQEVQEGDFDIIEDVEESSEAALTDAVHVIDESTDLNEALDAVETATDPAADEVVDDALDIDSVPEADAAAEAVEDEAEEQEPEEEDPYAAFRDELKSKPGRWYVIHSYAGFEKRVKQNIENRRISMAMEDYVYEVQVPMENVVEIKNGQRKLVNRVRIPGYVLVRMELNEDSWSVVRHTPGVTGFVGNSHNPTPLRFEEAFSMLQSLVQVAEAPVKTGAGKGAKVAARAIAQEVDFEIGETITIKEGSFAGLPGSISEIKPESGKLTVLVSLFERETPVELSFDQVTKL
jgi:transcription termination/antitermination protein NusG